MGTDRVQPANDDDARTGRGKRAADCLKIARGDEDTDAWLKLGGGWIAGYSAARWRKCGEINPTKHGGAFSFGSSQSRLRHRSAGFRYAIMQAEAFRKVRGAGVGGTQGEERRGAFRDTTSSLAVNLSKISWAAGIKARGTMQANARSTVVVRQLKDIAH